MVSIKIMNSLLLSLLLFLAGAYASNQQVLVEMNEYVDQKVLFNPLKSGLGIWFDQYENQSHYNLTGFITVTNTNPDSKTISDIYVSFEDTQNMTLPLQYDGRVGTFISNDTSTGNIILHIPELRMGENATFIYSINNTEIRPPLNYTTEYSDSKLLAGNNITIKDNIENVFDNYPFQTNTCIYDINITQVTTPVNFSGVWQDYFFDSTSTTGLDATNVTYSGDDKTQYWDVLNGTCLNKGALTNISYIIQTPLNIPKTTDYYMTNTTIRYKLNNTISHLKVFDIKAISEADIDFAKRIMSPSHPTLYGSNVTWNVTGAFSTITNITYNLTDVTFWVSQRNVNGSYTDPNTIDNDTISGDSLKIDYSPAALVNSSNPWNSSSWMFNYSDIPSPIVWMDVNFTIANDGTQLINRSVTRNGDDIYIKELYLIIGYWLEIDKNITSIGNNTYNIKIDVHNKGNQVTPADTVVTIYDFVPANYNINGSIVYSNSPWYNTDHANKSVFGTEYNGTLHQWGILPTGLGGLNTSFSQGPSVNENTTWSAEYNVTGFGDYKLLDVFVTGLDPQQVDGAGSTKSVVVSELIDRVSSTEGVFAIVASILLLIGLLL
ncbi:MAG: hypothetical protein ACOC16_01560 [Nanoarchaeota archaeon]